MSSVRDECGIAVGHSLHDTYKMMKALQHRGQEAAGIAVKRRDGGIDALKWMGLVDDFALDYLYDILGDGDLFIGHVRYSTSGSKSSLRNAHPHYFGGKETDKGDHIIARGVDIAGVHNGTLACCEGTEDFECDTMQLLDRFGKKGPDGVLKELPGAYSVAILSTGEDEAFVMRDRYGIRPLYLGKKDGRFIAASEDCAIRVIGGTKHRTHFPGEMARISGSKCETERIVMPARDKWCFFEVNYLASDESHMGGRSVRNSRYHLGGMLCDEFLDAGHIDPAEVDVLAYLPKCPEPAALGFESRWKTRTGHTFKIGPTRNIFYKKVARRAFMGQTEEERQKSIHKNLYLRDDIDLTKLTVLIIDDSIVRANNSERANGMCYEAGARRVLNAIYTPPLGPRLEDGQRGCLFGVDMPPGDKFALTKYGSVQGIADHIKADVLHYISKENMFKAMGVSPGRMCHYCIGGPHPMEDVMKH
jgi:amidophosphoribosyltransferase